MAGSRPSTLHVGRLALGLTLEEHGVLVGFVWSAVHGLLVALGWQAGSWCLWWAEVPLLQLPSGISLLENLVCTLVGST